MSPELILPVTEEEYQKAGSKFITFAPGAKKGDIEQRNVVIGLIDWDTPGKSIKFPVTITSDGPDHGKADKLSAGIDAKGIWKAKEAYENIMGEPMPMKKTSAGKRPAIDPAKVQGKPAVGQWAMTEGKKGGEGETILYPKLTQILPAGSQPETIESL